MSGRETVEAQPRQRAADPETMLAEELKAMLWVQQEVREGRPLQIVETQAIASSIFLLLQDPDGPRLPQLSLEDMTRYTAVHAINVAVLAMTLASFVQFEVDAVRKIGMAALLHDIGMARMAPEVLAKPGQLSAEERQRIKEHPQEGARMILEADAMLDLAAVVAYEHHLKMDGSGYPKLTYPRAGHYVSRLVQLCDIYHALRSPRPFREPWPVEIVFSFLNERAGFEFHPALASALTTMVRRYEALEPKEA